ncbi:MAG: hypothetical protein OEW58_07200 [Gammaproteobacteria bacterium]|nr:hypothetical protein [Gammaproteobacteria bacterium]
MSRLLIDFRPEFETDSKLPMLLEGSLAEHEQIWLWDHFFALVMQQLAEDELANHLLETLGQWAGAYATKIFLPVNELHAEGAMRLDGKLTIATISGSVDECYVIQAQPRAGDWPQVTVRLPEQPTPNRLAYAPIAVAQFFLNKNPLFFRELPLHILAMRKFYQQHSRREASSVSEAPGYAFQMAMRFFDDMQRKS